MGCRMQVVLTPGGTQIGQVPMAVLKRVLLPQEGARTGGQTADRMALQVVRHRAAGVADPLGTGHRVAVPAHTHTAAVVAEDPRKAVVELAADRPRTGYVRPGQRQHPVGPEAAARRTALLARRRYLRLDGERGHRYWQAALGFEPANRRLAVAGGNSSRLT